MKKISGIGSAITIVMAAVLPASAGVMDILYENTLSYEYNGSIVLEYYEPDGSYSDNQGNVGNWSYQEGELCTDDGTNKMCGTIPDSANVGDVINITLSSGETVSVSIISGR